MFILCYTLENENENLRSMSYAGTLKKGSSLGIRGQETMSVASYNMVANILP